MIPEWALRTKSDEQAIKEGACWDEAKAQSIVNFAHSFFKPQFHKGKFRLLQWQERFLKSLYGWRWKDGRRRFRFANLHIGKKNGKTFLTSIIALYELFCGEDPSPLVTAAAASKENAAQVFREVSHSIERTPFNQYCKLTPHRYRINVKSMNAEFKCFASDGGRVHGEPCSAIILDEVHAHKNAELYRALRYNIDGRPNGFVVAISTAGEPNHFYWDIYSKSKRILSGEEIDTIHYAEVYEPDQGADCIGDESQWKKANPSMGTAVGFPVEQFRRDLHSAKGTIGEWLNFQRLKLNLWVRPDETAWIDVSDWDRYKKDIAPEVLAKCDACIGVDLSSVADPSSISIVFALPDNEYYIKSWCWVAEKGIEFRNKGTLIRFDQFIDAGHMEVTDGDMIDHQRVFDKIIELCQQYDVRLVNFDPASAIVMANNVENSGYQVARINQTFRNFSPIMAEFLRAYAKGKVYHDGSTWLKYTLSNVRVEMNKYNEIRPYRKKSVDFIDGAISTLLAFNSAFNSLPATGGIEQW